MANYYIDTSIWLDYLKDRKDGIRPLGEFAFQFIKKVREEKHKIIFSRLIIHEISQKMDYAKFEYFILNDLRKLNLIKEVQITKEQIAEAERISGAKLLSRVDCLHAILARDNGAIVVSRNFHFLELLNVVKVRKPEELI